MVTEKAGYIGTSNWTEDYFTDTAGSLLNPYLNAQKGLLGDCQVLTTFHILFLLKNEEKSILEPKNLLQCCKYSKL